MVEKNQMGGEKLVLLIVSPMCCIIMIESQNVVERHVKRPGGHGVITTMMRYANRVSEVKPFTENLEDQETPAPTQVSRDSDSGRTTTDRSGQQH